MHRPGLITELRRDEGGASTIFMALSLSAVLGIVAVGLNAAAGFQAKGRLQAAADAAAHGGAVALKDSMNPVAMAMAIVAENAPAEDATAEVEWPPKSGMEAGNPAAVRVILSEPRPVLLASLMGGEGVVVRSAATARLDQKGPACLLALGEAATSLDEGPPGWLQLSGCVALSAQDGVTPGRLAQLNPYAVNLAPPACAPGTYTVTGAAGFAPGTAPPYRCGGIRVAAGGHLALSTPIAFITGPLVVEPGGRLTTTGTTLAVGRHPVLFEPGAIISLSPPVGGTTAGISLLGQPTAPLAQSRLVAGATQSLSGAIVLPAQALEIAGNSAPCTQAIARSIAITGPTAMAHGCAGLATRPMALQSARLVE